MIHKTRGIILQTIKFSETSVIAKIYTAKLGLVSYIIKGVRAAKSKPKAAMLQPLTLLDMEVSHIENKQLQYIREFRRAYVYHSIPFDTLKSAVALFLLEVISKSIREHEQNDEMFHFIFESLCFLDSSEKLNPDFHLMFLVQFTRYLGFAPHANYSDENSFFEMTEGVFIHTENGLNTMDKQSSKLLNDLIKANLFEGSTLKIRRMARKQMMGNLLKYYQMHIGNFSLKSPEILEEIIGA